MSTEIKSTVTRRTLTISDNTDGDVYLQIHLASVQEASIYIKLTAFLAAVEKECDVIIVRRADLPAAVERKGWTTYPVSGGAREFVLNPDDTYEALMADARALMALAEYRRAHPAVDEQQVDDLVTAAYGCLPHPVQFDRMEASRYIRALVASGRVEVKS